PRCSSAPARHRSRPRSGGRLGPRHRWSTAELQLGAADASSVAPVDRRGGRDLAAVEVGPVGRAHVLEEELPVAAEDPGMDLAGRARNRKIRARNRYLRIVRATWGTGLPSALSRRSVGWTPPGSARGPRPAVPSEGPAGPVR